MHLAREVDAVHQDAGVVLGGPEGFDLDRRGATAPGGALSALQGQQLHTAWPLDAIVATGGGRCVMPALPQAASHAESGVASSCACACEVVEEEEEEEEGGGLAAVPSLLKPAPGRLLSDNTPPSVVTHPSNPSSVITWEEEEEGGPVSTRSPCDV